jgi:hypothetical protein
VKVFGFICVFAHGRWWAYRFPLSVSCSYADSLQQYRDLTPSAHVMHEGDLVKVVLTS